jgi:hypothetical protein
MSRLILAEGSRPADPDAGKVVVYPLTNGKLYYKDDTGKEREVGGIQGSKSIIIESPSDSEDISFFFTDIPITATKIRVVLVGVTPSVTWSLRHGTDRSTVGTELITGGTVTTEVTAGVDIIIFDDPTIIANSHIWFETTAKSGTIGSIILTLFYNED